MHPYLDTQGHRTIGYGRNLDGKGISLGEARTLLHHDMIDVEHSLNAEFPEWRRLSDVRQRVVADMAFNLGISGLMEFRRTLNHIRAGRWPDAAVEMLDSEWARQVGRRAERLAQMMVSGEDVPSA